MALDLSVYLTQFVVREFVHDYDKHPDLADSGGRDVQRRKFGPYLFRTSAERKIESLMQQRAEEGWVRSENEKYRLFQSQNDISYQIEQVSRKVFGSAYMDPRKVIAR